MPASSMIDLDISEACRPASRRQGQPVALAAAAYTSPSGTEHRRLSRPPPYRSPTHATVGEGNVGVLTYEVDDEDVGVPSESRPVLRHPPLPRL